MTVEREGRKCETCIYFRARTAEEGRRGITGNGWCEFKFPPHIENLMWGNRHNAVDRYTSDWCHLWQPDLSKV